MGVYVVRMVKRFDVFRAKGGGHGNIRHDMEAGKTASQKALEDQHWRALR